MGYFAFLKQRNSIESVCTRLSIPLSKTCPFCGSNSLSVRGCNFKCYSPKCNQNGDVIDFLVKLKVAPDVKGALALLEGGQEWSQRSFQERTNTLTKVYEFYKSEALKHKDIVDAHLKTRGLADLECGLAISNELLLEEFFMGDLQKVGLLSKRNAPLFYNHLVFPYRDVRGSITHLQGRNLSPEADARWVSSTNTKDEPSIANALYGIEEEQRTKALVICEGVYDRASIKSLGIPCVGTAGLYTQFELYSEFFKQKTEITLLYDNDRYPLGTPLQGTYKSWPTVLKNVAKLYQACPELSIKCLIIPSEAGKDANDWLKNGLTRQLFLQYLKVGAQSIEEFALSSKDSSASGQLTLLQILAVKKDPIHLHKFMASTTLDTHYLFNLCQLLRT